MRTTNCWSALRRGAPANQGDPKIAGRAQRDEAAIPHADPLLTAVAADLDQPAEHHQLKMLRRELRLDLPPSEGERRGQNGQGRSMKALSVQAGPCRVAALRPTEDLGASSFSNRTSGPGTTDSGRRLFTGDSGLDPQGPFFKAWWDPVFDSLLDRLELPSGDAPFAAHLGVGRVLARGLQEDLPLLVRSQSGLALLLFLVH